MIISDGKIPFGFIHNPRTSGTSIRQFLITNQSCRTLENLNEVHRNHSTYAAEQKYRSLDGYYVFGFVRNPWSREYSIYKLYCNYSKTYTGIDFKTFVMTRFDNSYEDKRDWYNRPQYGWFCDLDGNLKSKVYRFEDRFNSIKKISDDLQLSVANELTQYYHNSTYAVNVGMSYIDEYDNEMIDVIANKYKTDIDAFGYYFDGYYDVEPKSVDFKLDVDPEFYTSQELPQFKYFNV